MAALLVGASLAGTARNALAVRHQVLDGHFRRNIRPLPVLVRVISFATTAHMTWTTCFFDKKNRWYS